MFVRAGVETRPRGAPGGFIGRAVASRGGMACRLRRSGVRVRARSRPIAARRNLCRGPVRVERVSTCKVFRVRSGVAISRVAPSSENRTVGPSPTQAEARETPRTRHSRLALGALSRASRAYGLRLCAAWFGFQKQNAKAKRENGRRPFRRLHVRAVSAPVGRGRPGLRRSTLSSTLSEVASRLSPDSAQRTPDSAYPVAARHALSPHSRPLTAIIGAR
jgi:hypothetical protein